MGSVREGVLILLAALRVIGSEVGLFTGAVRTVGGKHLLFGLHWEQAHHGRCYGRLVVNL